MSIQSHIHLALTLGGSPEFSPIYQWKVTAYQEIPEVILHKNRTSSGKLRWHTINNADGPIQLMGYQLTLKCLDDDTYTARQYKAFLQAMNGKQVLFVDIDHPDSGFDHSAYVRTMRFQINRVRPMVTTLSYYQIDVELEDDDTVT